ncbi:hypothetical protein [Caulobacter sp.]|uniref:hypothetical protein n=1 Tax=Caulobacter sp. TaxID=78 RepID=UPI001B059AD0|nr:hypothetical protein [Caulobacter sp.]MBO9545199.1 hypothetical protein [Caulobacter sp.]
MFPEYLFPYVVYLISLVVFGMAFWKGDRPLKLVALTLLVGWTLTPIVNRGDRYILNYPITTIDTNCALILVWISLRWRRVWCAVLAALTILIVIVPLVHVFDHDIHLYNRYAANNILSNLQLVVIAMATRRVIRDRRRADEGAVRP